MTTSRGLEEHERAVTATIAGAVLAVGLAGARFPKALAWPLAALLSLLGATGLLHVAWPAQERPRESRPPERPAVGEQRQSPSAR